MVQVADSQSAAQRSPKAARVSAKATDVAATVLYALGVPISRTLEGQPLVSLFAESFTGTMQSKMPCLDMDRRITSTSTRNGQPLDQEMIDRLRSLGVRTG